jgi:DNA-binding beta-propeller fold protein YncE
MRRSLLVLASFFLAASSVPSAFGAKIALVAGGGTGGPGSAATEAQLKEPFGTDFDRAGNLFIIEMSQGNRLLKVGADGKLTHVAGTGEAGDGGDGGPALRAQFNGPLAITPDGSVLIADTWAGRVRKVSADGATVSSLPGYGVPAEQARRSGPYSVALDFSGAKLHVADLTRVHAIDLAQGTVTIAAGNGRKGVPQDGAMALESPLVDPRAAAADRKGNLYILERGGHALRVVDPTGRIRTVVNRSGKAGAAGDGGAAIDAALNGPKHLCIDREDNVIIADAENHLIRKYSPATGLITRVAGTGKKGAAGGGGDPLHCELNRPHGVAVHPATGELYITDSYNHRVLKIVP